MRLPKSRPALLLGGMFLILTGCTEDQLSKNTVRSPHTDSDMISGTENLSAANRREFEAIAQELYTAEGGFFERGAVIRIRENRDAIKGNLAQYSVLTRQLILQLLQDGQVEAAIEEVDALFEKFEDNPKFLQDNPQLHQLRGLAYLRLAEVENCVNRHNADCCLFPLAAGGVHSVDEPAAQAKAAYLDHLEQDPENLRSRWLLNIASMALGEQSKGIPSRQQIPVDTYDSEHQIERFPDVAPRLGLDEFNLCGGCIVDDFNGDRLLDVVTSTIDPSGAMTFNVNNGDGTFSDISKHSNLSQQLGGLNIIGADYDSDGDVDILVLRGAWLFDEGRIRNSLLRNDGYGVFKDVTHEVGLAMPASPTQAAVFGDFNNDGHVDLYVANESRADHTYFPPEEATGGSYPSQMFQNRGDGTFRDVSIMAGVTNDRYAKGATAGDYDNDGDLDLYVSNLGRNRLYRNNGNMTFTDIAEEVGVQGPIGRSFVPWFFDYDNDGWLDLFVTAYDAKLEDLAADYLGQPHSGASPALYRNNADGTFSNQTVQAGIDRPLLPMGANFGDLDNDGYLDMYLTTGNPSYESIMPNVMLRNDAGRGFQDVTRAGGFGHLQKGHGVAFADIDNDGDQDVYHQVGGFYPGDAFHNALFLNPGNEQAYLTVHLIGIESNRSAYGARIQVDLDAPSGARTLHRAVGSVSSFGGSPRRQEIGLGDATAIGRLTVTWPSSGQQQEFTDVPINAMIEITEGDSVLKLIEPKIIDF
ncbi:MAG: CRTAC1 family protein [Phycisphaerales bacterium]|nr:CRTAC1 family protein [Phycisphaerales bacterium]